MSRVLTAGPGSIEYRGCRLAYRVTGDGPPVVFIQGVGVHGDGWRPQVDALKDRYRCLTFDNRGMGRSQPVGVPVTVPQMAEDTLALMAEVGWPTAHVVGHSLGGLVAVHLARTAPDRVRSLALLCTFADGRQVGRPTAGMIWLGLRMKLGTRRMRRRAFLELVLPPGADRGNAVAERLAAVFGHDLADQPPVVSAQLAAMRAYDATRRLGDLAGIPTVVASAAHDRIAPPALGRALAAGIPGSRFVELPDAAHGVTVSDPERVNGLLREHLGRVTART